MRIAVIMPTRGRPESAQEAIDSAYATMTTDDAEVIAVLDRDDVRFRGYALTTARVVAYDGDMITRTNKAVADHPDFDAYGWIADDNRFRTNGWDARIAETLAKPGIGYANLNDLFWSEMFPTDKPVNTFVRASIVRALGWFANPAVSHHFMDDTWRILGASTDSIVYLRDVVCEHLHPGVGKGIWDDLYVATENKLGADKERFVGWIWTRFREDRLIVKGCL